MPPSIFKVESGVVPPDNPAPDPVNEVALTVPVTPNVEPSNVRFPESSKAPDVPAMTTLLSVRSETVAELNTVSPPAILAPPSASIAPLISTVPVNVETPDTLS